jgi:phasin family protein
MLQRSILGDSLIAARGVAEMLHCNKGARIGADTDYSCACCSAANATARPLEEKTMSTKNLFAESSLASVEPMFGVAGQALQGAEQLTRMNLQTVRTVVGEFQRDVQAALSATTPDDLFKLQTAALQAAPQKATAYARQVQEIFGSAFAAQRAAADTLIAEFQASWLGAVDGLLKDAPGSESALALVKSVIAAANNAYEGVNNASKQVSDAVAANVTKVAEAA